MASRVRIVWSPLALERLATIVETIAGDRPTAAKRWLAGVVSTVKRLREFPQSGHIVPELEREDLREVLYPPYRIIYRVDPKRVVILTVRHGRREFDEAEVSPASSGHGRGV